MKSREQLIRILTMVIISQIIAIIAFCLCFNFYNRKNGLECTGRLFLLQVITSLIPLIGVITLCWLKNYLRKEEIDVHLSRIQLEHSREMIRSLRIQAHDFKNQLGLIRAWAKLGKNEEILTYLKDVALPVVDPDAFNYIQCPVLQALCLMISAKGMAKRVRFQVESDALLDEFDYPWAKVYRIFSNLLLNALEAIEEQIAEDDEELREIHMVIWEVERYCHFLVWSPTYLPPGDLEQVFLPGFTTKGSGERGMGLCIVKTLVKDLGGTIWLEYEKDSGTEFHVVLPKANRNQSHTFPLTVG